jgi:hypothetical protein
MRKPRGQKILSRFLRFVAVPAAIIVFACKMWGSVEPVEDTAAAAAILDKYLAASENHQDVLRGGSMEVDIQASVPNLNRQGRLHALRKISKVGRISYRVLGFQGDNSVKNQVIARYLQAEQEAQGKEDLSITPVNYKMKYKGELATDGDRHVYVFSLAPRTKKVGLFKGQIWLDAASYLPVYEKGRFVKNPSVFFKKVEFERAFNIQSGVPVPQRTTSTIQTRLVGKVELNVSYSKFAPNTVAEESAETEDAAGSLQ